MYFRLVRKHFIRSFRKLTKALKNKCSCLSLEYFPNQGIFTNFTLIAGRKFLKFKESSQTSGQCGFHYAQVLAHALLLLLLFLLLFRVSLYTPGWPGKAVLMPSLPSTGNSDCGTIMPSSLIPHHL